ncbi:hypothetical protein HK405_005877 [Cladochytrium tenue]|nr:hypothetical protein HK405_005877 [Cladochytrium tenue]
MPSDTANPPATTTAPPPLRPPRTPWHRVVLVSAVACLAHSAVLAVVQLLADFPSDGDDADIAAGASPSPTQPTTATASAAAYIHSTRSSVALPLWIDAALSLPCALEACLSAAAAAAAASSSRLPPPRLPAAHVAFAAVLAVALSLGSEPVAASRAILYFAAAAVWWASLPVPASNGNDRPHPSPQSLYYRLVTTLVRPASALAAVLLCAAAVLRAVLFVATSSAPLSPHVTSSLLVPIRHGTHRVHVACAGPVAGTRDPTVVLDADWLQTPRSAWADVLVELLGAAPAANANSSTQPLPSVRACWIDRPGYGISDSGPLPQTPARNAETLTQALTAAGEQPPFVLVASGHAAATARLFLRADPRAVVGLVLVRPVLHDLDLVDEVGGNDYSRLAAPRAANNASSALLTAARAAAQLAAVAPLGLDRVLARPLLAAAATGTAAAAAAAAWPPPALAALFAALARDPPVAILPTTAAATDDGDAATVARAVRAVLDAVHRTWWGDDDVDANGELPEGDVERAVQDEEDADEDGYDDDDDDDDAL